MAEHHHAHATPDDQYLNTTEGSGHEHTDANVWMIIQFAIWLLVSAVVTHGLMWGMFEWFVTDRNAAAPAAEFPLAMEQEPRLPAGPRLQPIPANEIVDFRQRESAELNGYGWVDRNAGVVHIPIAEAMHLAVQRGLPSRAQTAAAPEGAPAAGASSADTSALIPADSSSGRTMERRR
jgi:hypothetical protein